MQKSMSVPVCYRNMNLVSLLSTMKTFLQDDEEVGSALAPREGDTTSTNPDADDPNIVNESDSSDEEMEKEQDE